MNLELTQEHDYQIPTWIYHLSYGGLIRAGFKAGAPVGRGQLPGGGKIISDKINKKLFFFVKWKISKK